MTSRCGVGDRAAAINCRARRRQATCANRQRRRCAASHLANQTLTTSAARINRRPPAPAAAAAAAAAAASPHSQIRHAEQHPASETLGARSLDERASTSDVTDEAGVGRRPFRPSLPRARAENRCVASSAAAVSERAAGGGTARKPPEAGAGTVA